MVINLNPEPNGVINIWIIDSNISVEFKIKRNRVFDSLMNDICEKKVGEKYPKFN